MLQTHKQHSLESNQKHVEHSRCVPVLKPSLALSFDLPSSGSFYDEAEGATPRSMSPLGLNDTTPDSVFGDSFNEADIGRHSGCGGSGSEKGGQHHCGVPGIPTTSKGGSKWCEGFNEELHAEFDLRHPVYGARDLNVTTDTLRRAQCANRHAYEVTHRNFDSIYNTGDIVSCRGTYENFRDSSCTKDVPNCAQENVFVRFDGSSSALLPETSTRTRAHFPNSDQCSPRRHTVRRARSAPQSTLGASESHTVRCDTPCERPSSRSPFEGVFHFESEPSSCSTPPRIRRKRHMSPLHRTFSGATRRLRAPKPVSFSNFDFVSALNSSSDSESTDSENTHEYSDSDFDYEIEFLDSPTPCMSTTRDCDSASGSNSSHSLSDLDSRPAAAGAGEWWSGREDLPRKSTSSKWSWSLLRPRCLRSKRESVTDLERRVASLKQQLSKAHETESSLRGELTSKFRECAEISRRCADERAKNQRLVADHAAELERASGGVQTSLGELRKELDQAKVESADLRVLVEEKTHRLSELRTQFTDHETLWENERAELRKQIDTKTEDNAITNTLKQNLEARESQLKEELDFEKERTSSLEKDVEQLQAQVSKLEDNITSLTENAGSSSTSLTEARNECEQYKSRLSDAEAKLRELASEAEQERATAKEEAAAYERRIRDLEGDISKSKVAEARTEDDFQQLRTELEELAKSVRSEQESLLNEKLAHEEHRRSHEAILENLRAELKTSESMVEERSKTIETLTAKLGLIDELKAKNAKLQISLDDSTQAREDLAQECNKVAVRLEENARELHSAQTDLVEQTEVAETLKRELDRSTERVANLTKDIDALKAQDAKTRENLQAITTELTQRSSEVALVRSHLDAAREKSKTAETQKGELEDELETLKAKISSLEADAESTQLQLKTERSANEAKVAELVTEHSHACAQLESTIADLNKSLDTARAANAKTMATLEETKAKAGRDLQTFELEKKNQDVTVKQLISKLAEVNGTSARQTEHITMLEEQVEEMHTLRAQLAELNASLEHLKGVEEDLQSQQKVNFAQREQIRSLSEEFDNFKQETERVSKARRQETELLVSSVSVLKSTVESAQLSQLKYNSPDSSLKDRLKFSEDMINRMLTEDIQLLNTNTYVLEEKETEAVHIRQLCSSLLQELATLIMQINHQVTVSNFPGDFKAEAHLKQQLYVVQEEHASLKSALTTAEDVKKHMFEQVRDKNGQLELMSEQHSELQKSCDARQQKIEECEREILSLRKQLRELELLSAEAVDNVRELTIAKQHNEKLKKLLESEQLRNMDTVAASQAASSSMRRSGNPSGSLHSSVNNSGSSYSSTSSQSSHQRPSSASSNYVSTNPFASTNPFGRPPSGSGRY